MQTATSAGSADTNGQEEHDLIAQAAFFSLISQAGFLKPPVGI